MTLRLLEARQRGAKNQIKAQLEGVWRADLEPALSALGRDRHRKVELQEKAVHAFQRSFQHLMRPDQRSVSLHRGAFWIRGLVATGPKSLVARP
jgi:hypothetical protein